MNSSDYIKKIIPRSFLKSLVVNICDHCNLNCINCDHFSPIAKDSFEDPDSIEKDLRRMRELIGDKVGIVAIMGGEPLLHPEVKRILSDARVIFPDVKVWLSTNGLLLRDQDEDFWKICREYDIELSVTKYPVIFDYEGIKKKAESKEVKFSYISGDCEVKTSYHIPLDLSGMQDGTESFLNCFHSNDMCNMLSKGRLYTCTIAPSIHIFNEHFGASIPMTEKDGIDIYGIGSGEELFEALSRPMPVCRFCDVRNRTFGHKWEQSKGSIAEWTMA